MIPIQKESGFNSHIWSDCLHLVINIKLYSFKFFFFQLLQKNVVIQECVFQTKRNSGHFCFLMEEMQCTVRDSGMHSTEFCPQVWT